MSNGKRTKLSTVETRPAILLVTDDEKTSRFVKNEDGSVREFKNRKEAEAFFVKEYITKPTYTASVYVKGKKLEFVHTVPKLKSS